MLGKEVGLRTRKCKNSKDFPISGMVIQVPSETYVSLTNWRFRR